METNPDFFDKSDATNGRLRERFQDPMDPTGTSGAITEDSGLSLGGESEALKESRQKLQQSYKPKIEVRE